jgi:protein phosphatase
LNQYQPNSPITSYFGGSDADLKFDSEIFVNEFAIGDLFLICSDGLHKSLKHRVIKSILDHEEALATQAERLLTECRAHGADDNVSVILAKRTE